MNIPVTINSREGYLDLLKLLSSVPPFNTLRPRETEILAELMYFGNKYGSIDKDVRDIMTFDYTTRAQIMEKYGITTAGLNNNLTSLRKKGFITDRKVNIILPNLSGLTKLQLTFDITVKDE